MPRKVKEYTVPLAKDGEENRDAGKTYRLTEMPALQAEKWAMRAFLAIAKNGGEVPPEVLKAGFAGLVPYLTSLVGAVRWEDANPLLDEMLGCVEYQAIIDSRGTKVTRAMNWDEDVEEVSTLLTIRKEVMQLHKGFLRAAFLSSLGTAAGSTPGPSPSQNA